MPAAAQRSAIEASLAIPYLDGARERLFYPDFIIRQGDKIGIFDTTSGIVAEDKTHKATARQKYIRTTKTDLKLRGGIVTKSSGIWHLNDNEKYQYDERKLVGWKLLKL